jgi:CRISPR/Cas system-associated exonuclease Cas4 (RecB family)
MPVAKDLSDLPPADKPSGNPPVPQPEFVSAIAYSWFDQYLEAGSNMRAKANPKLPYRASYTAFRCDRQLYYAMIGMERAEPNIADSYRMSLGTLVHTGLEDAIKASFPNAEFEVAVDLTPIGVPGSAHADIVTYLDQTERKVDAVVEVKTVNGFGFKSMATDFKGPAQGPRSGHVLQAALSAMALDADRVVIAYLSMENLSPTMKRYTQSEIGRFAAEWHYTREEYTALAKREIARIQRVTNWLDIPDLIAPTTLHDDEVPAGAYVQDPGRGMWVNTDGAGAITDTGRVWFCDYCDWREVCSSDQTRFDAAKPVPF